MALWTCSSELDGDLVGAETAAARSGWLRRVSDSSQHVLKDDVSDADWLLVDLE
jgi:hypothetical protein